MGTSGIFTGKIKPPQLLKTEVQIKKSESTFVLVVSNWASYLIKICVCGIGPLK